MRLYIPVILCLSYVTLECPPGPSESSQMSGIHAFGCLSSVLGGLWRGDSIHGWALGRFCTPATVGGAVINTGGWVCFRHVDFISLGAYTVEGWLDYIVAPFLGLWGPSTLFSIMVLLISISQQCLGVFLSLLPGKCRSSWVFLVILTGWGFLSHCDFYLHWPNN